MALQLPLLDRPRLAPRPARRPAPRPAAAPPHRAAPGRAPRGLGAVALTLALLAFGANMASPLYPGYQAEFGFSDLTLTVIYATYAVVSVPALLVFGPLGDRLGWRPLLRVGLALGAVGSLCFIVATGPLWLLAGRVANGLALGAATGAGMAALVAAAPPGRRGRYSALGGITFVAGTAAGPALTGLLAELTGSYPASFAVHLAALAAVWCWLRAFNEPTHSDGSSLPPTGSWWVTPHVPEPSRRVFTAAAASGAVSWTVVGLFLGLMPSVVSRAAGTANLAVLGALAATVLVAAMPTQIAVTRLGAHVAQRAGLALLAIALLVLALSGAATSIEALMLAAVLAGLGHGLAYGGAHEAVQAATRQHPDKTGGLIAAAYVVFYLGAGVPSVAVGLLSTVMPLTTSVSALGWVALLACGAATATTLRAGADPTHLGALGGSMLPCSDNPGTRPGRRRSGQTSNRPTTAVPRGRPRTAHPASKTSGTSPAGTSVAPQRPRTR